MKLFYLLIGLLLLSQTHHSQTESQIASVDFVTVINNNHSEALFYYQNNWKALREEAVKKAYIQSYQLLEVEPTTETPYNFILITTYANSEQYDNREAHFQDLIKASGGLKLLNEKKPNTFRTVLGGHDRAIHK